MKTLNAYLIFPGNCREAMNFYHECLGGEMVNMITFEGAPMEVEEKYKNNIMHAQLKSDAIDLMASDGKPGGTHISGNNISLSLNVTSEAEQDEIFEKLSKGGKIVMELEDTFWGARFGMITDKFGIQWMLNYYKPQK